MKKNWWKILIAVIIGILIPLGVHWLMTFGNAVTHNDWIGFFGNYFGSIIGIIVAIAVSRIQVNGSREDLQKQLEEQDKQVKQRIENERIIQKIENRVFIDYTMFRDYLLLSDRDVNTNSILLPRSINFFIHHNPNDYLKDIKAEFLKLEFYGTTDCVLELDILIHIRGEDGEDLIESMYKSGLNKGHTLYVPLFLLGSPNALIRVEIEYTTLTQERIRFVSDMINYKEFYSLIKDNSEEVFHIRELKNEIYMVPGNPGHTA
jgi:hypothetical protein